MHKVRQLLKGKNGDEKSDVKTEMAMKKAMSKPKPYMKGGKAKPYMKGGKVKKYRKGGSTCRGMGAATRGGKFYKDG
jgi:hypothetical protein